ncbi:PrsW family intramembrane metalloprotease, partial [Streptomyces sp. SID4931]|nr:PrsW family intramembrane metalloprotease [Streptomyces sp. SID4931]
VGPDFGARERELLHHLWQRRDIAAPALTHAARLTSHRIPHHAHHAHHGYRAPMPYGQPQAQQVGYGYGYGDPGSVRPTPR